MKDFEMLLNALRKAQNGETVQAAAIISELQCRQYLSVEEANRLIKDCYDYKKLNN